ncbi:MAG: endonuclease/exonuclease/phosphatase family protein [Geminicoccaceae bacterium]|nr:endonuclease/exonuclease/phosphatase family protein [Geminicoccaceae bacterium]
MMLQGLRSGLVLLDLLFVLVTALSLTPWVSWWVRFCDFPRVQFVVLGLVGTVGLALFQNTWAETAILGAAVAALLVQLWVILPYTPIWRKDLAPARGEPGPCTLRLLVVNVLQDNRQADGLLDLIRKEDPDAFFALETDPWWDERLATLEDRWPHSIRCPIPNTYGLVFRSRLELVEPELRFLLKKDIPSIRTKLRLRSGALIHLHGIHPEPPAPGEADTSLPRDAELVLAGREIATTEDPVILIGDLNDVAWSHTSRLFRRLSHLIDPRIGRGMFNTFDAKHWFLRWPLDHVFVSEAFLLRRIERLPHIGSDHFPILVELDYVPELESLNTEPQADAADEAEADEKLAQAYAEDVDRDPAGGAPAPA